MHDEFYTAPAAVRAAKEPLLADESDLTDTDTESEDAGAMSDPGMGPDLAVRASTRRRQRRQERKLAEQRRAHEAAEHARALELSRRQTRMRNMAPGDTLVRVCTLAGVLDDTRADMRALRFRLDRSFGDQDDLPALTRQRAEREDRLSVFASEQTALQGEIEERKKELKARGDKLRSRKALLRVAHATLRSWRSHADKTAAGLQSDWAVAKETAILAHARRKQLVTTLEQIFPIESVGGADNTGSLLFSILEIPLPNSSYSTGRGGSDDEDAIASALGYVAHVVFVVACYLSVPLHYPLVRIGSRSAVVDPISMMRGPRAFPLYGHGVDAYRFEYAVFLLNKNIEQVRQAQARH